jgi:hypothetical protein
MMATTNTTTTGLRLGTALRLGLVERMIATVRDRVAQDRQEQPDHTFWTRDIELGHLPTSDTTTRMSELAPQRWQRLF